MNRRITFLAAFVLLIVKDTGRAQSSLDPMIDRDLPALVDTYRSLHSSPELSYYEERTSAFLAKELRALGFDVTEGIGKYVDPKLRGFGIVALMKNGKGPTALVRTDMDGLPVEEKTGLPYASRVRAKDSEGEEVNVMHACGHDIHMTCFLGTAKMLSKLKDRWHGTVIMIGQPAEERGGGAMAMLNDGLYTRFPKPDYAVALHDNATLEAGKVGMCEGYALASVTSVDITIRGVGGHGAYPHTTKDPVVVAAEVITALQTIVSRENSPFDPAVVTVGSIHGGTKHNIIPDEVKLQLTVRAYREEVRKRILASIERITKGITEAAGIPTDRAPIIRVYEDEFNPATYNDPELTRRLAGAFRLAIGKENVVDVDPVMGGEDFGFFSLNRKIPLTLFWLGAIEPPKV